MINYLLITGTILFIFGILMKLRKIDFILDRFQGFHEIIRKKEIEVKRDRLATFYSYLYIVIAIILLIGAIITYINPEIVNKINLWTAIAAAIVGIGGILYCNLSKRFLF